jgi:hypothetical protein
MQTASVELIKNGAASGSGMWPGGRGVLAVAGTFGGATITLDALGPDGTTYLPVKAMAPDGTQTTVSLTAAGHIGFLLPPGTIRCTVTGGAPSGLYATAARVPE